MERAEGGRGGGGVAALGAALAKQEPECPEWTMSYCHMTIKEEASLMDEVLVKEEPEGASSAACASGTGAGLCAGAARMVKDELECASSEACASGTGAGMCAGAARAVKVELECASSAACASGTGAGLCADAARGVKDELELGPARVQHRPDIREVSRLLLSSGEAWPERGGVPRREPAGTASAEQNTFTDTMHHTAETHTHKCNTCGEIFLQKQCLIDHIKVHLLDASETLSNESLFIFDPSDTSIKQYTCRICNKKFRKDYLKIHERVHTGEKPYTCEVCKKQFAVLGSLREHKRIHTEERPYSCDLCSKSYARLSYLKTHKLSHTNEKPYECQICKTRFAQKSNLKSHIRTHTRETLYSCTMCDKQFMKWSALNNHKRSHKGEKTYPCNISKNEFKQGASNVHEVINTIENQFSCETCKETFRKKSSYEKHKRKHELVSLKEKPKCESSTDPCGLSESETHKETRVKEEPKCESTADSCRVSETAAAVDYVIKDELELGPEGVQRRDISLTPRGVSHPLLSSGEAWPERGGVPRREPAGTAGAEHDTARQNKITDTLQYTGETYTYKCYTCGQIFLQQHCLIDHVKVHLLEASETLPNESLLFILEPSETGVKKYSCKICKKKYQGKYLKIHERFHTGEKPYVCEVCTMQFADLNSLRQHKRTHTGERPYSCDVCAKSYARSRYLKIHKLSHTGEKPHSCEICKKRFGLTSSLKTHMRTHTGEEPYGCTICKKRFTQWSVLETHKRTHDKPYSCDICKMTFMQLGALHVHELIHTEEKGTRGELYTQATKDKLVLGPGHTQQPTTVNALGENSLSVVRDYGPALDRCAVTAHDEPAGTAGAEHETVQQNTFTDTMHHTAETHTYKCNTCGEIFQQKQCLIDHIKVHLLEASETLPNESLFIFDPSDASIKKYTCRICTKKFRKDYLKIHERFHTGEKPYTCEVCKKQFAVLCSLKEHKRMHTGERPYSCNLCAKSFARLNNLKAHKRSHSREKPYKCKTCQKGFTLSGNLRSHIRTHTGETPYSCTMCDKQFMQWSALNNHKRSHTGEKTYPCDISKNKFKPGALSVHKDINTIEKPFSCETCKKTFRKKSSFEKHKHKHELVSLKEKSECESSIDLCGTSESEAHKETRVKEEPKCESTADSCRVSEMAAGVDYVIKDELELGPEGVQWRDIAVTPRENSRSVVRDYGPALDRCAFTAHDEPAGTAGAEHKTVQQNTFTDTMHHTAETHTYKCNTCGEIFQQKQCLIDHIKVHLLEASETLYNESLFIFDPSDTSIKKYTCRICTKKFRKDYLKIHERVHTGEKPYICEVCKKQFAFLGSLTEHKRMHTGEKPYSCNLCAKSFARLNNLKTHKRSHSREKPYKCETCQKGFTLLFNLRSHIRTHTGETPYSCTICDKQFMQWSALNNHKRSHTGEKTDPCDISRSKFKQGALSVHKDINTIEKPFSCETCKKTFRKKSSFEKHKQRHELVSLKEKSECESSTDLCGTSESETHKKTRVKEEPKCESTADSCRVSEMAAGVDYVIKDELELGPEGVQWRDIAVTPRAAPPRGKLLATTSGASGAGQAAPPRETNTTHDTLQAPMAGTDINKQNRSTTNKQSTSKRPYTCDICKKAFTQSGSLNTHKRIHTGEKPYSCKVCNKKFTALATLNNHTIALHTDIKPYSCEICNKGFKGLASLKSHGRRHTAGKPYSCDICKKQFRHKITLKKHNLRVHTRGEAIFL